MKWYHIVGLVLFGLVAFGFILQLAIEVWNQVIMKRYKIPEEIGSFEVIEVANEILDCKRKIEPGGWLSKEEWALVDAEIKRRKEKAQAESKPDET